MILALLIPVALSLGYTMLIGLHFFQPEGSFNTLSDVQLLFTNPMVALAGWVQFLAFDFLIGRWIAR